MNYGNAQSPRTCLRVVLSMKGCGRRHVAFTYQVSLAHARSIHVQSTADAPDSIQYIAPTPPVRTDPLYDQK
jgi:hypothetical protein